MVSRGALPEEVDAVWRAGWGMVTSANQAELPVGAATLRTNQTLGMGESMLAPSSTTTATSSSAPQALPPTALAGAAARPSDAPLGPWERAQLRALFQQADRDGSGELEVNEVVNLLEQVSDFGVAIAMDATALRAAAEACVRAADADKNGQISWREFSRWIMEPVSAAELRAMPKALARLRTKWRALSAPEARAKSNTLYAEAQRSMDSVAQLDPAHPKSVAAQKAAADVAARAARLADFADRLEGLYDPPEAPAPTPAPASDVYSWTVLAPAREAAKAAARGGRHYKVPRLGEESDSESDDDSVAIPRGTDHAYDAYRKLKRSRKPHLVMCETKFIE